MVLTEILKPNVIIMMMVIILFFFCSCLMHKDRCGFAKKSKIYSRKGLMDIKNKPLKNVLLEMKMGTSKKKQKPKVHIFSTASTGILE